MVSSSLKVFVRRQFTDPLSFLLFTVGFRCFARQSDRQRPAEPLLGLCHPWGAYLVMQGFFRTFGLMCFNFDSAFRLTQLVGVFSSLIDSRHSVIDQH